MSVIYLPILLYLLLKGSLFSAADAIGVLKQPLLEKGKCSKHVWRQDAAASLPGRCFGVNPLSDFKDEFKDVDVKDSSDCRSLCCNLEQRCTVWQYQNSTQTCFISKRPVRRGFEGADTPFYCDPHPTHNWNGKHKGIGKAATVLPGSDGKCLWAWELPRQCFSFGPERMLNRKTMAVALSIDPKSKGFERMNTQECEDACCKDPTCDSFQEYPGRGCYFGSSTCRAEKVELPYEGGRKCLPGFCGGPSHEAEILGGLEKEKMEKLNELVLWLKNNPA